MEPKKLPDAEFELMRIIWDNPSPITTNQIIDRLGSKNRWKPQTVLTLLSRLTERGFLLSERQGKERRYSPLVEREAYMAFECESFMRRMEAHSFANLVSAFYQGRQVDKEDLAQMRRWLDERGEPDGLA